VVAADVYCVTNGVEKHTATALASISMLDEKAAARLPNPADRPSSQRRDSENAHNKKRARL
jgi:hypothetical protein